MFRIITSWLKSEPTSISETREVDAGWPILATIAIASPELQRHLLVAIGDSGRSLGQSASRGGACSRTAAQPPTGPPAGISSLMRSSSSSATATPGNNPAGRASLAAAAAPLRAR